MTVLDISCGTGSLTFKLAAHDHVAPGLSFYVQDFTRPDVPAASTLTR